MRYLLAKSPTPWRGAMGNEREREESRRTNTRTENNEKPLRVGGQLLMLGLNLAAPIALYYGLRAAGVGISLALIVGAAVPALGAVVKLIRRERLDFAGLYMMTILLLGAGVALLTGSPRFLLARDGWLTGVSGVWMLLSVRSQRPLTFLFARPLLEGITVKMAGSAGVSWDTLWERSSRFRHIWHMVTIIWGLALLVDAALRVVMAYTLPVDLVPGLSGALWPVTFVVLQVITNIYFARSGFWLTLRSEM